MRSTEAGLRSIIREMIEDAVESTTLRVGHFPVSVEIARTPGQQSTGLMDRKSLDPDCGMLFTYDGPQRLSFWMRRTTIPLSIAFIGPDHRISEIRDMHPEDETHITSSSPCVAALEVNRGWFDLRGVRVGAKISNMPGGLGHN